MARYIQPTIQEFDSNGDPLAGGKLYFYATGTLTPKDTFSDNALTAANANPVVADAGGRFGDIFLESGTYRVKLTDSDDVEIYDRDPVDGSIGSSGAVVEVTSDTTITLANATNLLLVDASSGPVTITLIAAATAGDGFELSVKKSDNSANAVTIDPNGSETVEGAATLILTEEDQTVTIRSDASNWLRKSMSVNPGASKIVGTDASGNLDSISVSSGGDLTFGSSAITHNFHRGHLWGGGISNNGVDASHDIDIAVLECRDFADAADIVLSAALTKQIDASWVTGDDQGGLSSTLTVANNTWYHVFAIIVAGVADVGFDTSLTAANLVTDHSATAYYRLGSIKTDGSANIIPFLQTGDNVQWDVPIVDVDILSPGTSAVLREMSSPLGIKCEVFGVALMENENGVGNGSTILTDPDTADTVPALGNTLGTTNLNTANTGVQFRVMTDTSSQIRSRSTETGTNVGLELNTFGYVDTRGRLG